MEDVREKAQKPKLDVRWLMLVILVLRRQRQGNGCKVKGGQHQMSQPVKVLAPSLVNGV